MKPRERLKQLNKEIIVTKEKLKELLTEWKYLDMSEDEYTYEAEKENK